MKNNLLLLRVGLIVILLLPSFHVIASSRDVSSLEFGNEWPFTVQRGTLVCKPPGAVVFISSGKKYAVNGLAMSGKRNSNIRPIWKSDLESDHAKYMIKKGRPDLVPKISISPIINAGLKLCG
jgi:hypothetical protein